jgi:hypothetical protein
VALIFEDGPAAGRYGARRAPHFLRAVVARSNGRVDLLDQLYDEPRPIEDVHVYEATGPTWDSESSIRAGTFVCPPPQASGTYRHRADVDGEQLRETAAWRSWCRSQVVSVKLYDPTVTA